MTDVQPSEPSRKRVTHRKRALPAPDPSLPHRDGRREAFALGLFEGKDLYVAYEEAGFKHPKGNAQRMEKEPLIAARLAYLRARLDELDFVSRSYRRLEVRRMLNAIVKVDRTSMFDEVEFERTIGRGKKARKVSSRFLKLKPLSQLTEEQRQLFEGLGDGGRALMPPKLAALAQLCKLDGLDMPTKIAPTNPEGDESYNPAQLSDRDVYDDLLNKSVEIFTKLGVSPTLLGDLREEVSQIIDNDENGGSK